MRILLVGDCHGNDVFFEKACRTAAANDCQTLISLGDWGYWPHYESGRGYIKWCSDKLEQNDLLGYWLPGNHENWAQLIELYGTDPNRKHQMANRLWYLPRGYRWTWDGISFMAVGGAYSIDKAYRVYGQSWWPEETLTDADVVAASRAGDVDIMLTHDAPDGSTIPCLVGQDPERYPESQRNRERLRQITDKVQPRMLVHGHYHQRYTDWVDGMLVEGLASDMQPADESMMVIDTENLRKIWHEGD